MLLAIPGLLMIVCASIAQSDEPSAANIRLINCRIKPAGQVTLSANQSGSIATVPQEGDQVTTGQRVIQLDDELAKAALAVAEKQAENDAEIRHAVISSDVARLEYEQATELNNTSKRVIPTSEVRTRKLEYDRSLLLIEQSRHQQEVAVLKRHEAAAQLKAFSVNAPFDGKVVKVLKKQGESVRQGEPVLELVNARRVRVEGFIDVSYRERVAAGTRVQVESDLSSETSSQSISSGTIVFVDSVVQPVTRQLRVWADVDNSAGTLISGMTATMTVVTAKHPTGEKQASTR
ncbi:MAG: HlyD family efflux transporter periplasmic adaptor subunit [Planctomycetota bacterium]